MCVIELTENEFVLWVDKTFICNIYLKKKTFTLTLSLSFIGKSAGGMWQRWKWENLFNIKYSRAGVMPLSHVFMFVSP